MAWCEKAMSQVTRAGGWVGETVEAMTHDCGAADPRVPSAQFPLGLHLEHAHPSLPNLLPVIFT